MSEQNSQAGQTAEGDASKQALNAGRRKLVRAGLAAAPVVAAFKSNMVLAAPGVRGQGTTVRASSFASFRENGGLNCSAAPPNSMGRYLPMSQCKTDRRGKQMRFAHGDSNMRGCGFKSKAQASGVERMTVSELLNMQPAPRGLDQRRLAQFCAAAFLSAETYGDSAFMRKAQITQIWEGDGRWSPSAGIHWDLATTMGYFERVYESGFDACLTEGRVAQADDSDQRTS